MAECGTETLVRVTETSNVSVESRNMIPNSSSQSSVGRQATPDPDRIRAELRERLLLIEDLALKRVASTHRLRDLEIRIAELENERLRWNQHADQWETERQTIVNQLEHDRSLLAEAWKRVEHHETQQTSTQRTEIHMPAAAEGRHPLPKPRGISPPHLGPAEDPIAQSVLRQFKTLLRDVRNNNT